MPRSDVPSIIKKVGFDFYWSNSKVWKVKAPVTKMPIQKLEFMFTLPLWNNGNKRYALLPSEVIEHPEKHRTEYKRVIKADLRYPIDIMFNKGRWLILDGLHRLVKAKVLGYKTVKVRKIPYSKTKEIVTRPIKHH